MPLLCVIPCTYVGHDCLYKGGREYLDVLEGALWLQDQQGVDDDRIGIYGLSYGGLNCLQALARNSSIFKVARYEVLEVKSSHKLTYYYFWVAAPSHPATVA